MKKEAVQSKGYGAAQMDFSVNSVASVFFSKRRMRKDEKGGGFGAMRGACSSIFSFFGLVCKI